MITKRDENFIPRTEREIYDYMNANIKIIHAAIHKYGIEYDEAAFSEGWNAMYNAIKTYDETKGKLSSRVTTHVYHRVGNRKIVLSSQKNKMEIPMCELVATATGGDSSDDRAQESFETVMYKDSEDIQDQYEKQEMYKLVLDTLATYINNMPEGLKKKILTTWYFKYECDVTATKIAAETGSSIAYVRKVKKEVAAYIKKMLRKEGYEYGL